MSTDLQPDPSDLIGRIARLAILTRALRVLRAASEYPPGHSERSKLPGWVSEWEREHGQAPASAERVLRLLEAP